MTTYAIVETYCDNWQVTFDYNEMVRFEAPPRPDPRTASLAECEEWDKRHAAPAFRRAARKYPHAIAPRALVAIKPQDGTGMGAGDGQRD